MYEELKGEFDYIDVDDNPYAKFDYYDRYDDWSCSRIPRGVCEAVADYAMAGKY